MLSIIEELKNEWYCGNLTAEEVLFLAEIENFAKLSRSTKGIWLSNKQFAIRENCHIRNIQRRLGKLAEEGYIKIKCVTRKNGKIRRYIKTCWSDANRQAFEARKENIAENKKQIRKLRERNPELEEIDQQDW